MSDDVGLEAALCALTALNETQLAGLDRLAEMTDTEMAAFGEQVDQAWNSNQLAVVDTKETIAAAMRNLAAVETRAGQAARRRDRVRPVLNSAEVASIEVARGDLDAAFARHEEAKTRFKAGVTADQLEA